MQFCSAQRSFVSPGHGLLAFAVEIDKTCRVELWSMELRTRLKAPSWHYATEDSKTGVSSGKPVCGNNQEEREEIERAVTLVML
jgi:hypothetical protein